MSNLTKEWSEYNHDYEKKVQDIRLKNGKEVIKCWPHTKLNISRDCYEC